MIRALAATLRKGHIFAPDVHTEAATGGEPELRVEAARVWLRPLALTDAEAMYHMASDPLVTRYLPWVPAPSVDAVRPFLEEMVARRLRGESLPFAVIWRETGEMIGSTDLMGLRVVRGQAELG